MANYVTLLTKIHINETDSCICNYLLTDTFEFKNNKLAMIFKSLIKSHQETEAYEIIICGLYEIGFRNLHYLGSCPKSLYDRHKNKLNKEKLFFIDIYKKYTDKELSEFVWKVFNEKIEIINCNNFFRLISKSAISFDETLESKVKKFHEFISQPNWETDGKRQRTTSISNDLRQIIKKSYYKINENRNNFCLIFNNKEKREGSTKDVETIRKTFSGITGFKVEVVEFTTKSELLSDLNKYCQNNSQNSDMIVCFFMTHGNEGLLYDQAEAEVYLDEIFDLFSARKALTLAGKPKILIFQSCRGTKLQEVIEMDSPIGNQPIINNKSNKLPTQECVDLSDFYIINSTVFKHASMRDSENGSYFINKFCPLIQTLSKTMSLDELCTTLNMNYMKISYKEKTITQLCEVRKILTNYEIYLDKPDH